LKHAGAHDLDQLEDLLLLLRQIPALRERSRGVFYFKSRAFLHFHGDPAGLFADLRCGDTFERFGVNSAAERPALFNKVARQLK
jgi:hypothetical protein